MANRQLLPIKFKDEFVEWLKNNDYIIKQPTNICEAVRAQNGKKKVIVYQKLDAPFHLSVRNEDVKIVREFLKDRKVS